uniref:Uncharacterized protein n=1 Tax=Photinus pyralis TaxID=7054 RepID=A0A1Y1KS67_PHOPY
MMKKPTKASNINTKEHVGCCNFKNVFGVAEASFSFFNEEGFVNFQFSTGSQHKSGRNFRSHYKPDDMTNAETRPRFAMSIKESRNRNTMRTKFLALALSRDYSW